MNGAAVFWREDGTPFSPRFGDIYRSAAGGLAQARHVFLTGCGLLRAPGQPALWEDRAHWAILETGFGLGLNFLATWQAWRSDPRRPTRLSYAAVDAFPPTPQELLRSAAPFPQLQPLAEELARRWQGLQPGLHTLSFEGDSLLLLLSVGDVQAALRALHGDWDSIFLDGFAPSRNPRMWELHTLKLIARRARMDARAATWCVAAQVRQDLAQCGFQVQRVAGLPPKRHALQARFAPAWRLHRPRPRAGEPLQQPGRCLVAGAGLAGASVAWSLARRGWKVHVAERSPDPASAASAVPVGIAAPQVSPDDQPLSRLTRAGLRITFDRVLLWLRPGRDYALCGVLERPPAGRHQPPAAWQDLPPVAGSHASCPDSHASTRLHGWRAGLPASALHGAVWHPHAGWIKPAELVAALLAHAAAVWHGNCQVLALQSDGRHWIAQLSRAPWTLRVDLVVLAAGPDTGALIPGHTLPLQAIAGELAWGPAPTNPHRYSLPAFPVNGRGGVLAHVPDSAGAFWLSGATFTPPGAERPSADWALQENRTRMARLLPAAATALQAQWDSGRVRRWAGLRAALPDHLPAAGPIPSPESPGDSGMALPLHICTGLGARGLALGPLCGELLAARLHGEPLPLDADLARRLLPERFLK